MLSKVYDLIINYILKCIKEYLMMGGLDNNSFI